MNKQVSPGHLTMIVKISAETYEGMQAIAAKREGPDGPIHVNIAVEVACKNAIAENSPVGRQVTIKAQ